MPDRGHNSRAVAVSPVLTAASTATFAAFIVVELLLRLAVALFQLVLPRITRLLLLPAPVTVVLLLLLAVAGV